MQIINIDNQEQLNSFADSQKHSQFLQAWQWGEFHKKVSGLVVRLGVEDNGKIIAAATIIKKELPMGKSYFYCPRGPVIEESRMADAQKILEILFDELKKIASYEEAMFLRFDPVFKLPETKYQINKTIDVEPSKTLILGLDKSEEELLKAMHQKTRYNIRLAEKKSIKIVEPGLNKFNDFWSLLSETSSRDDFRLHGIDYYREMLKVDSEYTKLLFAQYKGELAAGNIVSFFGDTVTYAHGASANEFRNTMAPYLLQWHTIKLAKAKGYKYYDFFGIDEFKWPGVTRFKLGFSGEEVEYPGTFDAIFDIGWYQVYKMVRRVRRTF
ncbi:hypothetical protein COV49_03180 [Candidatus Falkowbacteria bacterium CG11_big_fil_rev_8_21_14_0_20_39_10]|uniref:Methicillin resistance protein n=1 Tax=Candidatus Falkowbacteria bacterium CG11_big_fil_rev_8_21_14_0_20_39_10 TaxID=1974570 RepID=A0A2M6K8Y7_9BACT|nr:MAG: hypothetical protein COV49_03180 [Candidatus Falkowbacteria bacterium CG11_big_fil_rev_8_21_14_0_20_39_10]